MLKKNNLKEKLLETFYRSAVESLLTYCITVWYCSCTEAESKGIQTFKFLGTIISALHLHSADLKWSANTTAVIKKALPESVEEEQLKGEAAGDLLSLCSGEPADILYHSMVLQLY